MSNPSFFRCILAAFIILQSPNDTNAFTHPSFLLRYKTGSRQIKQTPTISQSKYQSKLKESIGGEQQRETAPSTPKIRFLGKGDRAVVRPGVVLVAPNHEYNHFLMRSAVFIHGVGDNEYGELVARGVIIDHPTAFTMGEMGGGSVSGALAHNILFQGGDNGNDSAMLLHTCGREDSTRTGDSNADQCTIDCGEMIGTSGIYEGGVQSAMDLADEGLVDTEQFKFFFNYIEFTDNELEGMLSATDSDGDAWMSVEVPPRIILDSDYSRGDAWSYLRNQLRLMKK